LWGFVFWASTHPASAFPRKLRLVERGRSNYRIVVADEASPSVRYTAEELQRFLFETSGASLPIVSDRGPLTRYEIVVGDNAHLREAGVAVDVAALGQEGYYLKTVGQRLFIVGSEKRGALYGVYGLLEDHLGCRWFTPDESRIPRHRTLDLSPLDERCIPPLEFREVFTYDCFDADWCARNRVNSHASRLDERHGDKMRISELAHTFNLLVSPKKHFASHAEYFSLVHGKRLRERTQLCCTNEDVIRLCIQATLARMRAHPELHVFSVSQNDCFNYCQCAACQALARCEGSQMAPVLALVNRVAEAVEKEFPQNTVETLAYQWTRKPPRTLRPRKNVIVTLCSIECCFSHSLESCDSAENAAFRTDLEDWSKTGARLWVWDYATDFAHDLLPFPNQHVRRDNIRYYLAHGVRGIFEQDTYNTPNSELAALGGYLTARFLWNPDYNEKLAFREFLYAYYGRAAQAVREYIALMERPAREKDLHVHIFDKPDRPQVADDLLLRANGLWREAERRVEADPVRLRRVRISRLSVDYAIVERTRMELAGHLPLNEDLKALALERYQPFLKTLKESGITRLHEWRILDFDQYSREVINGLGVK